MAQNLAIDGGQPTVPKQLVEHNWQRYRKASQEEKKAVAVVLDGGLLGIAAGKGLPNTAALETEFAEWVGTEYCVVVDSGTAGLHHRGTQTSPIPAQLSFQKQNQPQTRSHPWNRHGREDRNGILHE